MENIHLTAQQIKRSFSTYKKYGYITLGIILGLCFFYLFKSCSLNTFTEAQYFIGQDTRWRELNLMGKERNLSAFNNELLTTIARQEHFYVYLTETSHLIPELEQGKLQGILTTLQPNHLNEKQLIFSEPYFLTGPVLIVPITTLRDGWNEKRKKIIGISNHSSTLLGLEQDPSIQLRIYDDILPALNDLNERRIDGAIFPAMLAYTYVQTFYKNELKIATSPLNEEGIRLVTLRNHSGEFLIEKFNEGLEILKQNGIYNNMLERWGLMNVEQIQSQS